MKEKIKRSKSQREAESIPAAMFWDQSPRTACDPGTKLLTAGGHRGTSHLPIRSSPRKEAPPTLLLPQGFSFQSLYTTVPFTRSRLQWGAAARKQMGSSLKAEGLAVLYPTVSSSTHTHAPTHTHTLRDKQIHTHTHVVIQTGVLLGSFISSVSFFRSLVFNAR